MQRAGRAGAGLHLHHACRIGNHARGRPGRLGPAQWVHAPRAATSRRVARGRVRPGGLHAAQGGPERGAHGRPEGGVRRAERRQRGHVARCGALRLADRRRGARVAAAAERCAPARPRAQALPLAAPGARGRDLARRSAHPPWGSPGVCILPRSARLLASLACLQQVRLLWWASPARLA
jgi:hypothetical protein